LRTSIFNFIFFSIYINFLFSDEFIEEESNQLIFAKKEVAKSKNKDLRNFFDFGFGIHHAGMLRSDRNLVERLFGQGHIRVLCCTSYLYFYVFISYPHREL
jgi:replicative superfamily II helicase